MENYGYFQKFPAHYTRDCLVCISKVDEILQIVKNPPFDDLDCLSDISDHRLYGIDLPLDPIDAVEFANRIVDNV